MTFRFTIRDVLWLTVVVGLCLTLWSERIAYRAEKSDGEFLRFWNKGLESAMEREGYYVVGADLGIVELVHVPAADRFPAGLSRAERRLRLIEAVRKQDEEELAR